MALYFFGVPLEEQSGSKRFARFLIGLMLVPSLLQALCDLALPASVDRYLIPAYWYGGLAVSSGLAVAWALNHRGAVVRLYGILPITPRVVILLAVGTPFVYLLFRSLPPEGDPRKPRGLSGGLAAGRRHPLTASPLLAQISDRPPGRGSRARSGATQKARRTLTAEGDRGRPHQAGAARGRRKRPRARRALAELTAG